MVYKFSGFRDGHCHPLFAARESAGPNLDSCETVYAVLEALSGYLEANPDDLWVDAGSVDRSLSPNGQLSATVLDTVSQTIPVVVHASDHHAIWVNTAALRVAGLEHSAPAVPNAHIDVDESGKPTGMIHEWDAMNLVYVHQPKPSIEDDLAALHRAQNQLLANGVVAVQEAWIDPGMPEVYLAAVERNELVMRVNLAPRIAPQSWQADLQFAKATRSAVRAAGSPLLTCNTVKLFIDGVFGSETALLKEPYASGDCTNHGTAIWENEELLEFALAADSAGFQLHFHAIGDGAVSTALAAVRHVDEHNGFVDRRPVIAHAELVSEADLLDLRKLGVVVCQQPVWARPDSSHSETAAVLGEERAAKLYPIATLLGAGITVSFGSDWPVSLPNPLPGLYSAETRTAPELDGSLSLSEAVNRQQALYAYSVASAFQMGQETLLHEDWVEFDTHLATCSTAELLEAKVLRVCVAGQVVDFTS
jgi:predicted amidohydrolase YtcJ